MREKERERERERERKRLYVQCIVCVCVCIYTCDCGTLRYTYACKLYIGRLPLIYTTVHCVCCDLYVQ